MRLRMSTRDSTQSRALLSSRAHVFAAPASPASPRRLSGRGRGRGRGPPFGVFTLRSGRGPPHFVRPPPHGALAGCERTRSRRLAWSGVRPHPARSGAKASVSSVEERGEGGLSTRGGGARSTSVPDRLRKVPCGQTARTRPIVQSPFTSRLRSLSHPITLALTTSGRPLRLKAQEGSPP